MSYTSWDARRNKAAERKKNTEQGTVTQDTATQSRTEQAEAARQDFITDPAGLIPKSTYANSLTAKPQQNGGKEKVILNKILGGENPYPELETSKTVAEVNAKAEAGSEGHMGGGTVPSTETDEGSVLSDGSATTSVAELLTSILGSDTGALSSEDVMGQYAAMTGGRPSSAAISAGTAAKADAEATLLRELLSSGSDTGSGNSVLSSLLAGGEVQQADTVILEEYADFADLAGYETIVPVLEQMDNNANMASYLADMVNKNVIDVATALEYLNRFEDVYEVTDADGRADYMSMVQNVGGWTVVSDGGRNRSGTIDRNAKVKAPTGETLTLAQLYRALKKRGMEKDEARDYIIKLQNHLGI